MHFMTQLKNKLQLPWPFKAAEKAYAFKVFNLAENNQSA